MADDFPSRLEIETSAWLKDGLVSEAQRQAILARYRVAVGESPQHKKLTGTIATMGATLVGVGVILFFASNWQKMSPAEKMTVLLGALCLSHWTAYHLDNRPEPYPRMARTFNFLGCILYGANIFLLAQAYNINAHWPNGVLWWAIGTLPFAFLLSSRAMSGLGIGALTFWMTSELSTSFASSDSGWGMLTALLAWGCATMTAGRFLERNERLKGPGEVFQGAGLLLVIVGFMSTTFYSQSGLHYTIASKLMDAHEWQFFFWGSTAFAFLAGTALVLSPGPRLNAAVGVWAVAASVWGVLATCALPLGEPATAIIANVVFLTCIIALLFIGYLHTIGYFINLGLLAFAVLVVARYFDFAWRYLDRASGFLLGGLLLLLLGFGMERGRRTLLRGPQTT